MSRSATAPDGADVRAAARVIAILGAESTGKTTLARDLVHALAQLTGLRCALVPEHLRLWCEREGRVPLPAEQPAVAAAQCRSIEAAAAAHDIVVADTTSVMTAVYSRMLFADDALVAPALAWHRRHVDQTLLTALDLPWVADAFLRDGAHVRAPIDAMVRAVLTDGGIGWSVIGGTGAQRVQHAIDAVAPGVLRRLLARHDGTARTALPGMAEPGSPAPAARLRARLATREDRWPQRWHCAGCDDPQCEARSRDRPPQRPDDS